MHNPFAAAALTVHVFLLLAAVVLARVKRQPLGIGPAFFCALVPMFGPVCALEMTLAGKPDPEKLKEMIRSEERIRKSYIDPGNEAQSTAPVEEALLINTPDVRREVMLKLLGDDPGKNIELLLMARFNDDPETAHYATATLTEYQRRTELSLQQSQMMLAKDPDNTEIRLSYIQQLESYIDSGLLEGHLLERQRLQMEKELDRLPDESLDLRLSCLSIRNLLELHKAPEAIARARQTVDRFPGREEPWLELMRIYVDCRDAKGLRGLGEELKAADVVWSYNGREKMEYFMKGLQ